MHGRKEEQLVRNFKENGHVIVRDYRYDEIWIDGQIKSKLGPLSYEVRTEQGSVWKKNPMWIKCEI